VLWLLLLLVLYVVVLQAGVLQPASKIKVAATAFRKTALG
jgi:hypothetical protein